MKKKIPWSDFEPLLPADIRRIRESLGLSQVEAGELLGGGIRAFQKYESGTITPSSTTISLLRILDADPTALGTLTGTHIPIQNSGLRPFEISGAHINALPDRFLVALTRRLLSAEAAKNRIAPDKIHVASVLTAADGGEDARITWEGGPERTLFLPSRNCILQVKATAITQSKAAKDVLTTAGDLEPAIRETLNAGGTYIMLCNRPYVAREVLRRSAAILETIQAQGVAASAAQVVFRDADQIASWANEHPQIATWVQEQTQPGLATTLRSYGHWAGRHEHETPFVDDERLDAVCDIIRPTVEQEREVARLVGLSGLGKSRLVLEALADADNESGIRPSDIVLYGVETELGSTTVKGAVQFLADLGKRAIIVVDRCDEETHDDLAAMVKRSGSRLSLITIDHEVPGGSLQTGTLLIERAKDSVIEALIKNLQPGLPTEDMRRIVKFANGFPQMAVLSAEAWVADISLATVSKDFLIEQVVLGRRATNKRAMLQSAKLLSVFGLIGFRDEAEKELAQVAALSGTLSEDDLRSMFTDLARRRVAQPRGRYLTLQPRPIALGLAERQWQEWGPQKWDELLTQAPPALRDRAAKQLAMLNQSAISLKVARHVCRANGPLDSYEAISDAANAGVIDHLSQVDTKSTGELLERVFDTLPEGALKEVNGDARSEIRWAVQRIAFVPETFELGAKLLFRLALAENESWSNNCTGQFKSLFPAYLGDTAADGAARLSLLDELIEEGDPEQNLLLVQALDGGTEVMHFSRTVGIESHGLRKALEPWKPNNQVAVDYIRECLERLLRFADLDDAAGTLARMTLANALRGLILTGFLDFVEKAVTQITQTHGHYWPEALSSLGDVISYDEGGMAEKDIARVHTLIAKVSPDGLRDRLKLLVTDMPWDYPCDEKLEYDARETRQQEAIVALAVEAVSQPDVLISELPNLSWGNQRMAAPFGAALAAYANDKVRWLWQVLKAYRVAPADRRNPDLLTSYLAEIAKTKPRMIETFKRWAIRSKVLAPVVPLLAFKMEIPASDIALVVEGLKGGTLSAHALYAWSFGGRLAKREPSEVAQLFTQIFAKRDQSDLGCDLMGMYVHSNKDRLEFLRPQLRQAADTAFASSSNTMNDHHFIELMTWLLKKGRIDSDARAVALSISRQLVGQHDDGSLSDERRIRPLLPLLLSEFPEIVWPLIGNAITTNPSASWRFQHVLGKGYSFGGSQHKAPIEELSEDTLLAWCHANPEVAPAFLARILPLLVDAEDVSQGKRFSGLVMRLIDDFGERDDLQGALVGNMHTFGWSGSLTTYYELYEKPLAALQKHAKPTVRRWAKKMSDSMASQIAKEQDSDDERNAQFD